MSECRRLHIDGFSYNADSEILVYWLIANFVSVILLKIWFTTVAAIVIFGFNHTTLPDQRLTDSVPYNEASPVYKTIKKTIRLFK